MALTKITGQVINNTTGLVVGVTTVGGGVSATDGFFSGIVTAVGDASFSGNVSVGGTLTYEDVTNIDAVGLVTARNGIVVGSGITLSPDGDIFFTGIMTGNGSGLTGVANTDVIFTDKLSVGDSPELIAVGVGSDLEIFHNGSQNYINTKNGNIELRHTVGGADEPMLKAVPDGAVKLYHNANTRLETTSGGVTVTGTVAATSYTGDGSALTGVGGTDFIHAEQISVSGIVTAAAFIPTTGQLSHRNLIINGAMQVAQRATSSTTNGYTTIDRYTPYTSNIGVTPTYSQVDVAAGTTPYTLGFRKAFQVTKGAGTANSNSQVNIGYKIEAQDMATSGWNYTNTSSFITLSFWVKTSVSNHNPQVLIQNQDTGTSSTKFFVIDIPTLTANTWTKITQTIPGHANQVYNNDNGTGLEIQFIPWYGTDYTDAGNTTGAWTSFGTKPVDTTWLTTNSSTFQITGIQLEVGSAATPFEHRSFGDELIRCQRYCFTLGGTVGGNAEVGTTLAMGVQSHSTTCKSHIQHPVIMRDDDVTFTFDHLTVDDDIASYAANRVESVLEVRTSATSSSLMFTTDTMNNVNVTRVLVDSAGGYIRGECEL